MSTAVERLAAEIRAVARGEARDAAPHVARFKVVKADPLVVEELGGDLRLEEGDPDVAVSRDLARERPGRGDLVDGVRDPGGGWLLSSPVLEAGAQPAPTPVAAGVSAPIEAVADVPFEMVLSPYRPGVADDLTILIYDPTDGTELLDVDAIVETMPRTYRAVGTITTAGLGRIVRWLRDGTIIVAEQVLNVASAGP